MASDTSNSFFSTFVEGQSTTRPPLFDGSNYAYWACRMKFYLQSNGLDTWNITQVEYTVPQTEYLQWTQDQKTQALSNSKAMNILFCSLSRSEFSRVSICNSAYEIWRTLQVTHEGTSKVKQTKISMLTNQFQLFHMKPNESICDMYSRFQDIVHALISLGKDITEEDQVRKILNSLSCEWDQKTLAIEEANDISKMKIEDLIGNLMSYEVKLQVRKENQANKKKSLALNATNDNDEPYDADDDDIEFITRKFKKFLKYWISNKLRKTSNNSRNGNVVKCFECDKPGHLKRDCPNLKKSKYSVNTFNQKRKQAFNATWDDSDTSSSDSDSEIEKANVCFMAKDDQVWNFNKEIMNVLNDMKKGYKVLRIDYKTSLVEVDRLKMINEMLTEEKQCLEDEVERLNGLNDDSKLESFEKLKSENESLRSENLSMKSEIIDLNDKITSLDNVILNCNKDLDRMKTDVDKFNKGKDNLENLLSASKPFNSKHGLGYTPKTKSKKSSTQTTKFVKAAKFKPKPRKLKLNPPNRFINLWVPRKLDNIEKEKYIDDFINRVHLSDDYILKGQSNSSWVWRLET